MAGNSFKCDEFLCLFMVFIIPDLIETDVTDVSKIMNDEEQDFCCDLYDGN